MAAGKSSRINRQDKTKYRIRNWREYERGLRSRGDVTIWLSEDAIAAWIPPKNGLRGGQRRDPGVFAKPRARKKGAVPAAVDDLPELPGQRGRQGVGIAHADEAQLGVAAQGPGDESDGCADRFQGAGRLRDDQAPALAIPATAQLIGDGFNVPVVPVSVLRRDRLERFLEAATRARSSKAAWPARSSAAAPMPTQSGIGTVPERSPACCPPP